MSQLKRNILANFGGNIWTAVMSLAFIPLYIRFMGIEAYGLVGLFATLQTMFFLLDLGLSTTLNRELAGLSVQQDKGQEMRDLVRTLEVIYWGVGAVIGVVVLALAPLIAHRWLQANQLSPAAVQQAIMIMGLVITFQWPFSFYSGGLRGLQRQVLLNSITVGTVTLRGVGAVLILWLVSPTIQAFFTWQVTISVLQTSLLALFLWRSLPKMGIPPKFQGQLLWRIWRFAGGMSGITLSALILTQLDKVILSKLLSLEMFGYYALAGVIGNGLNGLIGPIFNAVFPRFSVLVAARDENGLRNLYHSGTQLMAALTIPVAAVLALFPFDVLLLWTGSTETAQNASPIVSLLVVGTALNGLMNLPYALQLANGWTSIGLRINTFLIIVLIPGIFVAATRYGAVGAAAIWVVLNAIYMLIGIPLTHARLLKGETWRWLSQDVGIPLAAALSVAVIGRWLVSSSMAPIALLGSLAAVLIAALAAAALAAPKIRAQLVITLQKSRRVSIVADRAVRTGNSPR